MVTEHVSAPDVVRLAGVSKRFVVRKDNSLKERLVTFGRLGRRHREDFWALKDLDLTIRAGETIGLIGHNGSGKSTLLKIIGGILDATSGTVEQRGRIAALLELGAGFHPDLTGRENVYLNASLLGLSRAETDERFADILDFSGIGDFIDTQVKFYSSGMYVRLAFAVAVHTEPDILLVDEVLAVGDEAFQRKCLDKIREFQEQGCAIVFVTHSLGQVVELCTRAVLLDRGDIVYNGEPPEAVALFRDILEERRLASLTPESHESTTVVGFRTAEVTASDVGERGVVMPGAELTIDLGIRSSVSLENHIVAIQINNTAGQAVWGTTTKRMGIDLPALIGDHQLRFTVSDTRFGAGKYFLNLAIIDPIGVHLHDWLQATSFDAYDPKPTYGILNAPVDLTITPS